jgi:hypothetical protein
MSKSLVVYIWFVLLFYAAIQLTLAVYDFYEEKNREIKRLQHEVLELCEVKPATHQRDIVLEKATANDA